MLNDIFVKEKGANVKYAKPEKKQSKKKNALFCWMPKTMIVTDVQLLSER